MPALPIKNGMTLKLNHILMRDAGNNDQQQIMKVAALFDNYLSSMKFQRYGPTIIKNVVTDQGINSYIMTQIREVPASVDEPFEYHESYIEKNCILVSFEGPERMLPMAHSKAALFAYENDLTLNGTSYTIIKDRNEGIVSADLFVCVE